MLGKRKSHHNIAKALNFTVRMTKNIKNKVGKDFEVAFTHRAIFERRQGARKTLGKVERQPTSGIIDAEATKSTHSLQKIHHCHKHQRLVWGIIIQLNYVKPWSRVERESTQLRLKKQIHLSSIYSQCWPSYVPAKNCQFGAFAVPHS